VTAKKTRVQKERDPAQAGLPRIGPSVVSILAAASCSRTRRSRSAPQAGAASAPHQTRPTNCTPIGKPDGVAELRLILGSYFPTIEGISAVIAHSQIGVAQPYRAVSSLPAGFDYADIAVLDWIAAEGRFLGRGLLPI
jgi:hypothetical protein